MKILRVKKLRADGSQFEALGADLSERRKWILRACIEIFSQEGFTPCIYVAVIIDLEYVACIYIDWLSAYFLHLSIHRNFQHRNFTICQCRGISESKKIISMVDQDTVERQKKHSWRPCIEILRIYPAIWQNLAQIWPKYAKNGQNLTKKCRVWKFSISISS